MRRYGQSQSLSGERVSRLVGVSAGPGVAVADAEPIEGVVARPEPHTAGVGVGVEVARDENVPRPLGEVQIELEYLPDPVPLPQSRERRSANCPGGLRGSGRPVTADPYGCAECGAVASGGEEEGGASTPTPSRGQSAWSACGPSTRPTPALTS